MTTSMAEHEDTYDLFQRGRELMKRGDNAQATVSLEKAKRREPDKASIREALAAAPANDYAHYCLGRCLHRMGEPRIALGHYKMAAWLRPGVDYYQEAVDGLLD